MHHRTPQQRKTLWRYRGRPSTPDGVSLSRRRCACNSHACVCPGPVGDAFQVFQVLFRLLPIAVGSPDQAGLDVHTLSSVIDRCVVLLSSDADNTIVSVSTQSPIPHRSHSIVGCLSHVLSLSCPRASHPHTLARPWYSQYHACMTPRAFNRALQEAQDARSLLIIAVCLAALRAALLAHPSVSGQAMLEESQSQTPRATGLSLEDADRIVQRGTATLCALARQRDDFDTIVPIACELLEHCYRSV